jgi:hypothetical protein
MIVPDYTREFNQNSNKYMDCKMVKYVLFLISKLRVISRFLKLFGKTFFINLSIVYLTVNHIPVSLR